jgi:hypothetical protein
MIDGSEIDDDKNVYDRPGFLTTGDREFLEDTPEDIDNHAEKRRRIRQRTRSAFRDFTKLYENLPEKDREMIFEEFEPPRSMSQVVGSESRDGDDLNGDLANTLGFICLGLAGHSEPRTVPDEGHRVDWFEAVLREAFERSYSRLGLTFFQMSMEINSGDRELLENLADEIGQNAASEIEPNSEKVKYLIDAGEIDRDNLREFLAEELTE